MFWCHFGSDDPSHKYLRISAFLKHGSGSTILTPGVDYDSGAFLGTYS